MENSEKSRNGMMAEWTEWAGTWNYLCVGGTAGH